MTQELSRTGASCLRSPVTAKTHSFRFSRFSHVSGNFSSPPSADAPVSGKVSASFFAGAKETSSGRRRKKPYGKDGGYPVCYGRVVQKIEDGVFLPNGALNQLRREALAELQKKMLKP